MNAQVKKIQDAYALDQRSNLIATTAEQLPLSYEAVTDEWLTAVMCAKTPGAKVIGHRLSAPDTGSSNRRKIYMEYNDAGRAADLPQAVFCKATQDLSNRIVLGISGGAHCEAIFYTRLRPLLDIEAPVCFFARVDDKTYNSMIVLNDLSDSVLEFCNHRTRMTRERAMSQMRLLGRAHGRSFGNPELQRRLDELPTFRDYFIGTLQFGMREGSETGFAASEEVIPARLYARKAEIWPATLATLEALDQEPRTLAHGDVHLKNWYVAANDVMGLGDWQCCGRAQGWRDVAYAMATALTVEDRRLWERDLIAFYLEELAHAGGPRLSFDEAWQHYRRQLITALTWWTVTLTPPADLPDMQPRDVSLEFIRRIATAMDDHESLDA